MSEETPPKGEVTIADLSDNQILVAIENCGTRLERLVRTGGKQSKQAKYYKETRKLLKAVQAQRAAEEAPDA